MTAAGPIEAPVAARPEPAPRFGWPAPMPSTRDLLIAAAATVVSMVVVMVGSADGWFFGDAWDFIVGRDLADLGTLTAPHAGHLQFPVSLVYQLLYEGVGLDYWPWFLLPRVVGYAAMVYVIWLVIRRRGADPTVAWLTLAVLLFYGSSTFLTAATIGHHLVFPAVALAAAMYSAGGPRWTWGDQLVFAGLILVMVVSTSSGVAGAAALGIVGLCLGRFWRVAPGFVPAAVVYLGWMATNDQTGATSSAVGLDAVLAVPVNIWELVGPAVARTLAFPAGFGPVLAVVMVGAVVVWALRQRLDAFDAVWLVMAIVWMTMAIVVRVSPGTIPVGATRYGYMVSLILLPAVVPHLRLPGDATWRRVAVATVVLVVVGGNLTRFTAGLEFWNGLSAQVRSRTHAVGLLVAAGEPALDDNTLFPVDSPPGANSVRVRTVRGLLAEGWRPEPSEAGIGEEEARGLMRVAVAPWSAGHGCETVPPGESLSLRTEGRPGIGLGVTTPTTVEITYLDRFGAGERSAELTGDHLLTYPEGSAALVVLDVTGGGPLAVCEPGDEPPSTAGEPPDDTGFGGGP